METNYKVTMSEKQYNDYLEYLTTAPNIQHVQESQMKQFQHAFPYVDGEKMFVFQDLQTLDLTLQDLV